MEDGGDEDQHALSAGDIVTLLLPTDGNDPIQIADGKIMCE